MSQSIKLLASTNVLLGLWLVVAPFLWNAPTADLWSDVIVGALITLLAGYNWGCE
ncbi:SPW repeat domain-containing protein [Halococcus sediminicola]|uniref:SPW repeat domain-containing protein n=1 Tax=Halococcus sediminicola TaxID=1264579 RepID=UPI000AF8BF5A|nr:SPW repeat protein [Halococcus sediminicola]